MKRLIAKAETFLSTHLSNELDSPINMKPEVVKMEGMGRRNIIISVDPRYCPACGSPETEDGCSNSFCWRTRPNATFPLSVALQLLAVENIISSEAKRKGFMNQHLHFLRELLLSKGIIRPRIVNTAS